MKMREKLKARIYIVDDTYILFFWGEMARSHELICAPCLLSLLYAWTRICDRIEMCRARVEAQRGASSPTRRLEKSAAIITWTTRSRRLFGGKQPGSRNHSPPILLPSIVVQSGDGGAEKGRASPDRMIDRSATR